MNENAALMLTGRRVLLNLRDNLLEEEDPKVRSETVPRWRLNSKRNGRAFKEEEMPTQLDTKSVGFFAQGWAPAFRPPIPPTPKIKKKKLKKKKKIQKKISKKK